MVIGCEATSLLCSQNSHANDLRLREPKLDTHAAVMYSGEREKRKTKKETEKERKRGRRTDQRPLIIAAKLSEH